MCSNNADRTLRILQLTTNFKQGGIQRHILDLTEHLRDKGHQITLVGAPNVWGNPSSDKDFVALKLDQVSATGSSLVGRLKSAIQCAHLLKKIVRERDIDIVHSHETAPAIVAKLALWNSKKPKVITYHGSSPDRTKQFAWISKFCAETIVSPSQSTLDQLIHYGVPKERTIVLGLGIDKKPMPNEVEVSKVRDSLGLKPADVLFLSLSRLDFQKGIDVMIEVAKRVLSLNPNVVFAVGGTGPLEHEVSDWVKAAGVADRFKFMGSVSEVQNYLAAADVFILTSRWEALPISIVEAFRAGLPVVATDCGGVKELVTNDVGRLCRVGDIDGISDAVLELSGDASLRDDMTKASFEKSKNLRFDPQTVHEAFENFYRNLLSDSKNNQ